MVNYAFPFSVTGSTTEATKVSETVDISKGRIIQFGVAVPLLADATVRIRARYHGHAIFPSNPDGYFLGTVGGVYIRDSIPVLEHPFRLTLEGWNTSGSAVIALVFVTVEECSDGGGRADTGAKPP